MALSVVRCRATHFRSELMHLAGADGRDRCIHFQLHGFHQCASLFARPHPDATATLDYDLSGMNTNQTGVSWQRERAIRLQVSSEIF
jgi:hypothetical protein